MQRALLLAAVLVNALLAQGSRAADTPAATAPVTATPATTPVPVADFFRPAAMAEPVLSPNGRYLAVKVVNAQGRLRLAVLDMADTKNSAAVAEFSDTDIYQFWWVNDNRLVFSVSDSKVDYEHRQGTGLFGVDRNGEHMRLLIRLRPRDAPTISTIAPRVLSPYHLLLTTLRDGSADVIVVRYNFSNIGEFTGATPLRLNTETGNAVAVTANASRLGQSWMFDQEGQPRFMTSRDGDQDEVYLRGGSAGDAWRRVARHAAYGIVTGAFEPVTLGSDGKFYVTAGTGGADGTSALYRLDPESGKREAQPLVSVKGFDFRGKLQFDDKAHKLLGVDYLADGWGTAWLDLAMAALQAKLDKRLPGLINMLQTAQCGCSRWVVVSSFSDRQSRFFSLYDRETDSLEPIGAERPWLDPRRMALRDFDRFAARDGMMIPVYTTRPAGKGPWPTVVLVHGGPWVRGGSWEWDANSQFLASRGYLVIEPEFRGSEGYGERLLEAGFKQWGLAMQNDVADATRWAISKGLADAGRVCIAGASYGGYATLMGLVNDPDLYRCGVEWAGVTDINLMFDLNRSDFSEDWKNLGMPVLVGDQRKDAAQFAATSPIVQAAHIKQPLLMAYGDVDRRVPLVHGERFRDAVKKTNSKVEWIVYEGEGHGFYKLENRVDFWQRVEAFLARNLPQTP